jgi:hypothetical protein
MITPAIAGSTAIATITPLPLDLLLLPHLLLLLAISASSTRPLSNLQLVPQQLQPTQQLSRKARRRRIMTQHNHSF